MSDKSIACPKRLDRDSGQELFGEVRSRDLAEGDTLVLDFSETETMDSLGGAWLIKAADWARSKRAEFRCDGQSGKVAEFIELIKPSLEHGKRTKEEHHALTELVGATAFNVFDEIRDFGALLVDAVYWMILAPFEGRGFRWNLLLDEIHEMGVRAMWINFTMNFLLGLTIALLSSAQMEPLGLGIYVADLVIIGFSRELAALMTAVVVSARTGAAITAELATMKVQEEIDALRGMGLNVAQYLVAPKLLALVIVMPCLVALGILAGLAGGTVWGVLALGFRPELWLRETLNAADLGDTFQGLFKSFFFANAIVFIGCHNGLRVKGGSRGVGLMTTRAVVMDIFLIVVIDMVFASILYYVL